MIIIINKCLSRPSIFNISIKHIYIKSILFFIEYVKKSKKYSLYKYIRYGIELF